jgi:hypothetical protein
MCIALSIDNERRPQCSVQRFRSGNSGIKSFRTALESVVAKADRRVKIRLKRVECHR